MSSSDVNTNQLVKLFWASTAPEFWPKCGSGPNPASINNADSCGSGSPSETLIFTSVLYEENEILMYLASSCLLCWSSSATWPSSSSLSGPCSATSRHRYTQTTGFLYCISSHRSSKTEWDECTAKNQNRKFDTNIPVATVPIFTFMFLWAIYRIPRSVCLFCCRKICGPILWIYKSLTDTWMWKLGLRPRNSQKRNTQMGFSLQCGLQLSVQQYGNTIAASYDKRRLKMFC